MAWYLWLIVSIVVGFGTMVLGSKDDFMFGGSELQYGIFVTAILLCIGGFFHGWFKLLGW